MIDPRRPEQRGKYVLVVTGASGLVLALRLAEILRSYGYAVEAVVSEGALRVAEYECVSRDWFLKKLGEYCRAVYREDEWSSPLASSSNFVDVLGCVVVPASIKTVSLAIHAINENLCVRVITNCLRMGKPVVLVVRECPLGVAELRVLYRAARMGMKIVPAVVGFYTYPRSVKDVIDFIVGKVLDVLGIENELYRRWSSSREARIPDPCQDLYG